MINYLILTADALFLIWPILPYLRSRSWGDYLPFFALLCIPINILFTGVRDSMVAAYIITVILVFVAAYRIWKRRKGKIFLTSSVRYAGYALSGILRLFLLAVLSLIALIIHTTQFEDYSNKTWSLAFEEAHKKISTEYPFTDWKKIDWNERYQEYAPRIQQAESKKDYRSYYLALREYAFSIPDGHVGLDGDDRGLRKEMIGGGFGITILELDDGSIVVNRLLKNGPAEMTGIEWGAEILEWNNVPIHEALKAPSIIWDDIPQATSDGVEIQRLRFLVRSPIGKKVQVLFKNPGKQPKSVQLTAVDDQFKTLDLTQAWPEEFNPISSRSIESKILPEKIGYIRILGEMNTLKQLRPSALFASVVKDFKEQNVRGIIIDVRGNQGGMDELVPSFVSHFFKTKSFYEYSGDYDAKQKGFVVGDDKVEIEPIEPYFGGPLVVLIDKGCISSGEGIPLALARLPQTKIVGYHGTNGSFAIGGTSLKMPEGISMRYLPARSLDENKKIQVDSDYTGKGGFEPDIRPPMNLDVAYREFVKGEDTLLQYAVEILK